MKLIATASRSIPVMILLASAAIACLSGCSRAQYVESAPVPEAIKSFIGDGTHITVIVYRIGRRPATESFHGFGIQSSVVLDPSATAKVLRVLSSSYTYSGSHIGCLGVGATGVRLSRSGRRLDLLVDLTCDHLFDAETREEEGFLSRDGEYALRQIVEHAVGANSVDPRREFTRQDARPGATNPATCCTRIDS